MALKVIQSSSSTCAPVVGFRDAAIVRPANLLPQHLIDEARLVEKATFDPKKHLCFRPPSNVLSMKDIGFDGVGISPIAVSGPFPLFNEKAIRQMRAEVFSQPIVEKYQCSSDLADRMIRGFGPVLAPFIFDAWHSPEVLEIISDIAGIDLVPALDYDVGHINISINEENTELAPTNDSTYADESAFAWHRDSYAFVCVTMLSDCTGMLGGETAIRTGTGEVIKVRGPVMGTAVVMQGRYIEHRALKAFGGRERISMVTSFRARSPYVKDETALAGVRCISDRPLLYSQYAKYRLGILEERIRAHLNKLRRSEEPQRDFDIEDTKQFLSDQKQFLQDTLIELV